MSSNTVVHDVRTTELPSQAEALIFPELKRACSRLLLQRLLGSRAAVFFRGFQGAVEGFGEGKRLGRSGEVQLVRGLGVLFWMLLG